MRLFDQAVLLSQSITQFLTYSATECTLPVPFSNVTGTCILISDCLGFKTPGFCPGASDIQCCTDTFAPKSGPSIGDISNLGLQLVQSFEGWKPDFYCDISGKPPSSPRHCGLGEGILTIGWGHACIPESSCDSISPPLSRADGEDLLRDDLQKKETCVDSRVDVELSQNQFDALVSFAYNTGCNSLQNVTSKINVGDFDGATSKMKEYIKGGGVVIPALVKRRAIEVNLFNS